MTIPISGLTAATSMSRTDAMPAVVSSNTRKVNPERIAAALGQWIDPMDAAYGAVGNDSTDDTSALQTAFDAGAATGIPVWLPPKKFKTTGTLFVDTENTTIIGGALPARGRGATDSPSRTMKCATIRYTGSGYGMVVGKDRSTSAGTGTSTTFLYNVRIADLRIEAPNAGSGYGCMVIRNPFQCRFDNLQLVGPAGSGRACLWSYGHVDCDFDGIECDGAGYPTGVASAGTYGFDNCAEFGAVFRYGYSGGTPTTSRVKGSYFHYCQTGVTTHGLVRFSDDTVFESCAVGCYTDQNSRQQFVGCYFENCTKTDVYLGRNSSNEFHYCEFLDYQLVGAPTRPYVFDGGNIQDVQLTGNAFQNNHVSAPAVFSTNVTLAGEPFGTPGGDNSAVSLASIGPHNRFNKAGWVIGGASSGASFTFDRAPLVGMQVVPYRFKCTTSGSTNTSVTVTTVDGLAAYYMPMRGEVVGLQVELAANISAGSYSATVTHDQSGSDVSVSGLAFSGVANRRYTKRAPHFVSGASFDAGKLLKATFTGNTLTADGTHVITVYVAHGQDGRGLLVY